MLHHTLNLGILAHVDAGKTTLTERLLFAAGAIDELGSVDQGSTQTDTLQLERQRGITIKSSVASFAIDDLTVNLLDTPGHPDFIAEVDRVLGVLDGAILVFSAVEGVQSHSRILFRALQRLGVPTVFYVNKIDRRGADPGGVAVDIARRLTTAIPLMGDVVDAGTPSAGFLAWDQADATRPDVVEVLAELDESVLDAYVDAGRRLRAGDLVAKIAALTREGRLHPVFFGSAMTGSGVGDLLRGVARFLPHAGHDALLPADGMVFKIERGTHGEKLAYVRMRAGTLRTRDEVHLASGGRDRVTSIRTFVPGGPARRATLSAGEIGEVLGLRSARVGDVIGSARPHATTSHFAPPTLESIVVARRAVDRVRLGAALSQMAEQDPLINVHLDESTLEMSVSLYGEVQKEVIEATLASDYDLAVDFSATSTIFVERPLCSAAAVEFLSVAPNPFLATVGVHLEPAEHGTGVLYRIDPSILGLMPMAYFRAVEETVRTTLQQGLHGWAVIDCTVTMTHAGFLGKHGLGHQYFNKSMSSTGEDFRKLTPLVVMQALRQAGTAVHEPIQWLRLEVPSESLDGVLALLKALRAVRKEQSTRDGVSTLIGDIPAASVHALRRRLPDLTRGEGIAETGFAHYQVVSGDPPERVRLGPNPLDRVEYLKRLKVRTA